MIKKIKKFLKKNFTKSYWESSSSNKWHRKRKLDAYEEFNNFAELTCHKLKDMDIDTVIEVGTGAGTLIHILSEKLSDGKRFIGLDINKKQIKKNKLVYKNNNNLAFVRMDFMTYMSENNLSNCAIVAQNTFDYFTQEDLGSLFSSVYEKIDRVTFVISATLFSSTIEDSIERTEADLKVYYHNYTKLLKASGYEVGNEDTYGNNPDTIIVVGFKKD